MLRRSTPSSASLVGGDLSVDILHTEDSVRLGDGTNLMGTMSLIGAIRALPVDILQTVGVMPINLTSGTQRSKITDGADNVEIATVGAEKALKVSVIASVGGGGGGTAATDSAAFTATATQFTPIGGHLDDVTSDALAEGEMGAVRMTSGRALHVAVQNSVGVTGTFWQATQPVTGTFWQATQPVSIATMPSTPVTGTFWQATQPVSGTVTVGNASLAVTGAFFQATQPVSLAVAPTTPVTGTFWQATQPVSGTFWQATQPISGTVSVTALPAGANNIGDVDVLTLPGIAGDVSHDGIDTGNPVKIGGQGRTSFGVASVNGDRVNAMFDIRGRFITQPIGPRENGLVTATTITSSITETIVAAAAGVGVFKELVSLQITNSSTTGTLVSLRDASAGTIRATYYIPAAGGIVICPAHAFHQTTANNNWTITCGTAVASIYVAAHTMNVV